MKILIVGAGIAGLSLALALIARGIHPDLIERRLDWNERGLGLYLPGNASRAFGELGLLPAIIDRAMPVRRQVFLDRRGNRLSTVDTTAFWNDCGPCLSLPRADMHAILLESLGGVPIAMGRTLASVRHLPGGCEVTFDDGVVQRYDLVVGADGIRSDVRRLAIGAETPTYSGNVCWRFFAANTVGLEHWTVMIGRGKTLLAIPVDRERVYVYADMTIADPIAVQHFGTAELQALFADYQGPPASLLRELPSTSRLHFDRIETVRPESWIRGRSVLVGDAAHACSPSMAEGAGMACEDAVVLADTIASMDDIDQALGAFLARRKPRVSWVETQSQARDRMRRMPTWISNRLLTYAGAALYQRSYRPLLAPA